MFTDGVLPFFYLYKQPHIFHFALMLNACGYDINAGCINARVSKYICKLGYILVYTVEGSCEQMTQIMRKHLALSNGSLTT